MRGQTLSVATILARWRPGSEDWDWPSEFAYLQEYDSHIIARLIRDIAKNGVLDPLLLGDDGRVWDGHHRLLVARILGITELPVEYGHGG